MNRSLLIIGLLLSVFSLHAQTFEQFVEAADKAYQAKHYAGAYEYYGVAIQFDSSRTDLWYQRGESAQAYTAYRKAIENYYWVLRSPQRDSFPMIFFKMAQAKQNLGDYEEAVDFYERFLAKDDIPDAKRAEAEKNLQDAQWSQERIEEARDIAVSHLPEGINSPYSDYGFTKIGDTIYYSSNRHDFERDTVVPIRNLARIYRKVGDQKSEVVDGILEKKIKKSNRHTAYTVFNEARNRVYFTICDFVDNTDEVRCEIYYSVSSGGVRAWNNSQRLNINESGYTNTQPHLAIDPENGKEVLYFVSNRPGGKGGLDLYRAPLNPDGSAGEVEALSEINTAGNDVTPFFYLPLRRLYFSSDGYKTLGGLDIFSSQWTPEGFSEPANLGAPINSSFNDRGYAVIEGEEKAYFNSNRQDSVAIYWTEEREACCDDIYFVDAELGIKLRALTFDARTRLDLLGTTLTLIELLPNGEERVIEKLTNKIGNDYDFILDPGKRYVIRAEKEGYTEDIDTIDLNSPEFIGQREIERRLYLQPGVKLDVFTFRSLDQSELEACTVYLYKRTPNGRELVDSVVNPLENDFHFNLEYGNYYEIEGKRQGFGPAFSSVDLTGDDLPTGTIRRDLYLGQLLEVNVFDDITKLPLNGARVQLLPQAGVDRPPYGDVTQANTNTFQFSVDLDRIYRLVVTRDGYFDEKGTLLFTENDVDENGKITFDVYMRPPLISNLLPIQLFYDNDYPNPRTTSRTTDKEYLETNIAYYDRKTTFIESFTKGLDKEEAFVARNGFNLFFDRDVAGKRDDLKVFTEMLLGLLQEGKKYTLVLKGYASPRASSYYNDQLSARRLDAVTNYFERYDNGVLMSFIQSGALQFSKVARGENDAPKDVVSSISDERQSIFSIKASTERRVDIIDIQAQN